MQTLTPGSFLNLENAETTEALKFTARQLAEHTTNAVRENLDARQLENLALGLWQKADYVARETERRRLQQIFVENFGERFRELKPEAVDSPVENSDLPNQFFAPKETAETVTATEKSVSSTEQAVEIAEKTDEFLGIVKSGESFIDAPEREADTPKTPEADQRIMQAELENVSAPATTHPPETSVATSGQCEEKSNDEPEKTEAVKTQPATAEHKFPAAGQPNKPSASSEKEPFEFGKCAVSLNLTLLPGAGGNRQVLISTASHNLPPEIEYLEIADGEDLEQITELVKNKLARFRQSLPVKYIEQLRTAKSKTVKRSEAPQTPVTITPTQTAKKEGETTPEKVQTVKETSPPMNQPSAANEIQGSLF